MRGPYPNMLFAIIIAIGMGLILQKFSFRSHIEWLLTKYLFYIGMPLIMVDAVLTAEFDALLIVPMLSFILLLLFIIFYLIKRVNFSGVQKGSLLLGCTFGNYGFLGIPLSYMLFGNQGALIASLLTLITTIVHYTLGISLSARFVGHHESLWKNLLRNTFFYTFFISIILRFLQVEFPVILKSLHPLTTYLSLMLVALVLKFYGHHRYTKQLLLTTICRFFISPLIMILVLLPFSLPWALWKILLVISALPPAVGNTALSKQLGFDYHLSSSQTAVLTMGYFLVLGILFIAQKAL